MIVQERVKAAIEFSLLGRKSVTLEEVGHEYRRRSISGSAITSEAGGKTLKAWIEEDFSEIFRIIDQDGKPAVEFLDGRRSLTDKPLTIDEKIDVLSSIRIGTGIAERRDDAGFSFLQTKAWRAFSEDTHDIFVGAKGSGKSQILKHSLGVGRNELPEEVRVIHVDAAKDQYLLPPRAALKPLSIEAHKGIWLLLLAMKAYLWVQKGEIDIDLSEIENVLHDTGILEDQEMVGRRNRIVSFLLDLSKNIEFSAKAEVEGIGSIEFHPTEREIDSAALMRKSERACIRFLSNLAEKQKIWLWFAVDRTDILFDGDRDLELQSLHALLSIVRDDVGSEHPRYGFKVKLLLKNDVWAALSKRGIPEFSHLVARRIDLVWTLFELQKVIASRFSENEDLMSAMRYEKNSALKNRISVEDFVGMLLVNNALPDRGGPRRPSDWILRALRDASGVPTPRDFIQYFRKVIEYEREQVEREGGATWRRRHLFQQESLVMGRKLLALEKLEVLVGEFPRIQDLVDFTKRSGKRVLSDEEIEEAIGATSKEDLSRLISLGFLRPRTQDEQYEIPWFYFDALISRDRQVSLGYEVPNTKETTFDRYLDQTSTEKLFVRGKYGKEDGRESVTAFGRRVRLPSETIQSLRSSAMVVEDSIEFWIYVTRRGTWIIDSSMPLIVGQAYDFKIGGPSGSEPTQAVCVDEEVGLDLTVGAHGFTETDLGSVVKAVVTAVDDSMPICSPDPDLH